MDGQTDGGQTDVWANRETNRQMDGHTKQRKGWPLDCLMNNTLKLFKTGKLQ